MKLSFEIAISTVLCFSWLFLNAQQFTVIQETPIKQASQIKTSELTEAQAIELAEKFLEQNGYTDLPPD